MSWFPSGKLFLGAFKRIIAHQGAMRNILHENKSAALAHIQNLLYGAGKACDASRKLFSSQQYFWDTLWWRALIKLGAKMLGKATRLFQA
jgi:hypothetical protein